MFDYRTQSDTDANEKALSPFHFQLIFHTIQVLRELALMETAQKFTGEEERRERERQHLLIRIGFDLCEAIKRATPQSRCSTTSSRSWTWTNDTDCIMRALIIVSQSAWKALEV